MHVGTATRAREIIQAICGPQWTELKEKVTCAAPEEFLRVTRKSQHVQERGKLQSKEYLEKKTSGRLEGDGKREEVWKKNFFLEAQTNGGSMGVFKVAASQV